MKKTWVLTGEAARMAVCREILAAPIGQVATIGDPARTLEQNAKLWALLSDLSEQTTWHGINLAPEEWKDLLSAGLVKAKAVPNIEGSGFVILGRRTSKMTRQEFADLIEMIHAFGAERDIRWSDQLVYRGAE